MSENGSTHREHFECIPPNVVPMSPPHAKTSRVGRSINDDSSETLVLRKIWWAWHRPNELMVERNGEWHRPNELMVERNGESIVHPQGLHFGLKHPLALDQHRVDRRTEGRVVEWKGKLSNGRVRCQTEAWNGGHDGLWQRCGCSTSHQQRSESPER